MSTNLSPSKISTSTRSPAFTAPSLWAFSSISIGTSRTNFTGEVPYDYTARDLAKQIHSELGAKMLYAMDVRNGLRLPSEYVLHDRDIISIVAAIRKQ